MSMAVHAPISTDELPANSTALLEDDGLRLGAFTIMPSAKLTIPPPPLLAAAFVASSSITALCSMALNEPSDC